MVDVIRLALLAFALAVPPAAAFPPDGLIATEGPPPPDLLPGHGPDDLVRIHHKDTEGEGKTLGVVVAGLSLQMQMACSMSMGAVAPPHACSGSVCLVEEGSGALPFSLGDPGDGTFGFGVDATWIIPSGGEDDVPPGDDGLPEAHAAGEGREYGPYNGVFVSRQGQCGP